MFGKTNRHRDNYMVTYVVWPEKKTGLKRKDFKYKKNAFKYALHCGPGTSISKNVDHCGGSLYGGWTWLVDWAYPYKKKTHIKIYKYDLRKFGVRRTKEDKKYFGFSYKIFCKMNHIYINLYDEKYPHFGGKSIEDLMPIIKNLFKLFEEQGIDFDNPNDWMVEEWERYRDGGVNTLEKIPWGYWSDRCNWGRAYTIYMCYITNDYINLFEKLEKDFVSVD
jgi:hypothetical protein